MNVTNFSNSDSHLIGDADICIFIFISVVFGFVVGFSSHSDYVYRENINRALREVTF